MRFLFQSFQGSVTRSDRPIGSAIQEILRHDIACRFSFHDDESSQVLKRFSFRCIMLLLNYRGGRGVGSFGIEPQLRLNSSSLFFIFHLTFNFI